MGPRYPASGTDLTERQHDGSSAMKRAAASGAPTMRAADQAQTWFDAVNTLSDFGVNVTALAVILGVPLFGLAAWIGWRRPAFIFVPALASLALRPELLWGDSNIGYEWGLHQTLLVIALLINALRFGLRKSINWPIVALIVVFGLNLLFGNLHRDLTIGLMLTSLSLLMLPFAFTHVILAPDSRRVCTLVIVFTPLLSVAIGALLQVAGIHTTFRSVYDRLEGATGNAGVFGLLAFAGFAVALHESTAGPQARPWVVALACVNLTLVILSGTRMSILASAVLLLAYLLTSEQFRELLRQNRAFFFFGICLIGGSLTLYAPTLYRRLFAGLGRSETWERFYDEFWRSPIFGRGIGSGFIALNPLELIFAAPHNEYLHLLVVGGVLGFILCIAGIVLWYLDLVRTVSLHDREFLLAVAPALAIYAMTDNILVYPTTLALYAYLGVISQSTALNSSIAIAENGAQELRTGVTTHAEVQGISLRQGDGTFARLGCLTQDALEACLARLTSRRERS